MKMLTVIARDQPGLLVQLTGLLERAGVDIKDFSGQSLGGNAVLTLQAEPYAKAFRCLAEAGYQVVSHDHLLVRMENHSGALAELSRTLAQAKVDVRGMHIVSRDPEACIVALETPDGASARDVLKGKLVGE